MLPSSQALLHARGCQQQGFFCRRLGGQEPDVTVDKGYCHISVPKIVLRTALDGPWDSFRPAPKFGWLHVTCPSAG